MNRDSLMLTVYLGERTRTGGRLLCDLLHDVYQRHELAAAVLLRGTEGFGVHHTLHTERLLTLSEDLPLLSVAVDEREKIERALPEVTGLVGQGLVTIEPARLLTGEIDPAELDEHPHDATKLTVYCGRTERVSGRPAYEAVVGFLRAHGFAGATVLLGLDGMVHGRRERARFLSRNDDVPLTIVAVGDGHSLARVLPELGRMLAEPLLTLERVRVCKRDGVRLAEPQHLPETGADGLGIWQKLTVYADEQARYDGHALHVQLIRRLREDGAAGATALRGIWGYSGDRAPHGDRFFSLARHVPVLTTIVDRPEAIRRSWQVVDALTVDAGLVTAETVPDLRAVAGHPPGRG